jgi:acetolactate synthase-1/2/3 large subunit
VDGAVRSEHVRRSSKYADELASAPAGKDGHMHPNRIFAALRAVLKPDAITIADGGDILSFARLGFEAPRTYLDPGTFGCLGVGTPFGVAAALLDPGRQVVVVSGTGAFGINAWRSTARSATARRSCSSLPTTPHGTSSAWTRK